MTALSTIGFDLDGVLMRNPFESCVFPHMHRVFRTTPRLRALPLDEATARSGEAVRAAWRRRLAAGDMVGAYDWDAIFREAADALGGAEVPEVAELVRRCCGVPDAIEALPGAHDTLRALRAAGHRLVVITNGFAAYQEPVLDALGLLPYFDLVITPDRVGFAKPDPEAFRAAGELDWFVGDTLLHDVLGARLAGARAAWLATNLPDAIRTLPASQRASSPLLGPAVADAIAASPYRGLVPRASLATCTPDAVVVRLEELLDVVVARAA
ncbi:MAG: HAD family hydrolase [Trueperaceae bacterium]